MYVCVWVYSTSILFWGGKTNECMSYSLFCLVLLFLLKKWLFLSWNDRRIVWAFEKSSVASFDPYEPCYLSRVTPPLSPVPFSILDCSSRVLGYNCHAARHLLSNSVNHNDAEVIHSFIIKRAHKFEWHHLEHNCMHSSNNYNISNNNNKNNYAEVRTFLLCDYFVIIFLNIIYLDYNRSPHGCTAWVARRVRGLYYFLLLFINLAVYFHLNLNTDVSPGLVGGFIHIPRVIAYSTLSVAIRPLCDLDHQVFM